MDKEQIYNDIKLPNGGVVTMDRLAYEAYSGACISSHKIDNKLVWKYTLDFEDKKVETATKPIDRSIEVR